MIVTVGVYQYCGMPVESLITRVVNCRSTAHIRVGHVRMPHWGNRPNTRFANCRERTAHSGDWTRLEDSLGPASGI